MFEIDQSDDNGRSGKLKIYNTKIKTPTIFPVKNEYVGLENSQFTSNQDVGQFKVGTHVQWIWPQKMEDIKTTRGYNYFRSFIRTRLRLLKTPNKVLHFEFYKPVDSIDNVALQLLLQLQLDLELDVITIPNSYFFNVNYDDILDNAIRWKNGLNVDVPLMGVIYNDEDVGSVKSKLNELDCVGLSMKRESIPILYMIRDELKDEGVWIHSFSTPRSYRKDNWKGTAGPLINFFGIDSLSTYVQHPSGIRGFIGSTLDDTQTDKQARADATKYFNPIDYGKPGYENLQNTYGPNHPLSSFCSCSVCSQNTVNSIKSNYSSTFNETRSHEILGYMNESKEYRKEIHTGNPEQYIQNKSHARRIIF